MSHRNDHQGSHGKENPPPQPTTGGWVLSRAAVRQVDQMAVDRYHMPSIVLMENAAIGLAERACAMLDELSTSRAVILAGPGNNGGDGLALARHLHNKGHAPVLLLTRDPDAYTGDAATNLTIVRTMALPLHRLDWVEGAQVLERAADNPVLLVDCLLGTGLRDAPQGVIRDAILHVNRLRAPEVRVLAVDVPSGLDCDTGRPVPLPDGRPGPAIEADATVSFVALKRGFLHFEAQRWTGEVTTAGIGVPRELIEELGEYVRDTRPGPLAPPQNAEPLENPPPNHARPDFQRE